MKFRSVFKFVCTRSKQHISSPLLIAMVRTIPVVVPGNEEDSQMYGFSPFMDDSSLARMAAATDFLEPLNSMLAEATSTLSLKPVPVQGNGFCFFYVAAGVCGMDVSQTAARQVFACALEASCADPPDPDAFCDLPGEHEQRVAELLQHEEYCAEPMHRSPFEVSGMDKFDSLVRKQEVLDQRCYGDNP